MKCRSYSLHGIKFMKYLILILLLFVCCKSNSNLTKINIEDCGKMDCEYRITPYLKLAISLQEMGEKKAIDKLKTWAKDRGLNKQVILLCIMLFDKNENIDYPFPVLGEPSYFGGTNLRDWEKPIIQIYKGAPILLIRGHTMFGKGEDSPSYLNRCIKNCKWKKQKYRMIKKEKLRELMREFIFTTKWKVELSKWDKMFFMAQCE